MREMFHVGMFVVFVVLWDVVCAEDLRGREGKSTMRARRNIATCDVLLVCVDESVFWSRRLDVRYVGYRVPTREVL